jgi:hypothetical protein
MRTVMSDQIPLFATTLHPGSLTRRDERDDADCQEKPLPASKTGAIVLDVEEAIGEKGNDSDCSAEHRLPDCLYDGLLGLEVPLDRDCEETRTETALGETQ